VAAVAPEMHGLTLRRVHGMVQVQGSQARVAAAVLDLESQANQDQDLGTRGLMIGLASLQESQANLVLDLAQESQASLVLDRAQESQASLVLAQESRAKVLDLGTHGLTIGPASHQESRANLDLAQESQARVLDLVQESLGRQAAMLPA